MFTGIIQAVCTVRSVSRIGGGMRLTIDLGGLADDGKCGDSIAVSGACLTVAGMSGSIAQFDVSGESLARTNLASLRPASPVNVERALGPADRLGGHFVLGHIDGTATISSIRIKGQFQDIEFSAEPGLLDQMVPKGSLAVDGVSLTVAEINSTGFVVTVIPETLKRTTLGKAALGDKVNIETDIIIKTIKKHLDKILPQTGTLTAGKLKELGF